MAPGTRLELPTRFDGAVGIQDQELPRGRWIASDRHLRGWNGRRGRLRSGGAPDHREHDVGRCGARSVEALHEDALRGQGHGGAEIGVGRRGDAREDLAVVIAREVLRGGARKSQPVGGDLGPALPAGRSGVDMGFRGNRGAARRSVRTARGPKRLRRRAAGLRGDGDQRDPQDGEARGKAGPRRHLGHNLFWIGTGTGSSQCTLFHVAKGFPEVG